MADKDSQVKEVETTVEEVEKTKAEEATPEEEKAVEANGDVENGSEEKETKEDKEEEKNGHDESDKSCAIKRKSTGNDAKEEKSAEDVIPEKKAKIEEAPAEAESNGDAAETDFLKLISSEGDCLTAASELLSRFGTISCMFELLGINEDRTVPLTTINTNTLHKILLWAHVNSLTPLRGEEEEEEMDDNDLSKGRRISITDWEAKFLECLDDNDVDQLIRASDFLDCKELNDLVCMKKAKLIAHQLVHKMMKDEE